MNDWKKLREAAEAATPSKIFVEYKLPDGSWTTDYEQAKKAWPPLEHFQYKAWNTLDRFQSAANPTTILALLDENDSLRAEVERLRERYGWNPKDGDGVMVAKKILTSGRMTGEDIDRICRAHLEQYVQHRDVVVELCGIAERLANLDESQPSSGMIGMACMHRVREILDAIGKDGGNG